ncbi:MAG: hypothetical protein HN407_05560 [Chloroflexi bacterium]|jgi:hypothetical protein|nr:hypothetical protein [Chloroflexota bacterium]
MKRLLACTLILGLVAGIGCHHAGPVVTPNVRILAPGNRAVLEQGESVLVEALISVDYVVEEMQVRLWDVGDLNAPVQVVNDDTFWEHIWTFEHPSQSQTFTFEETIVVPSDTLPGENYRLEVMAVNSSGGSGYSLFVQVIATQ